MKKILILFIVCFFFIISPISFANMCEKMLGQWSGEWEDHHHKLSKAILKINQVNNKFFSGKYFLLGKGWGRLHGKCKDLTSREAYLTLGKEAPWYNPCRGTLIKMNNEMAIHFYCFSPNQSGYFTH